MGSVATAIWPSGLLGCGRVDLALCVWLPVCDHGVPAFCPRPSLPGPGANALALRMLGLVRYREPSIRPNGAGSCRLLPPDDV